MIIPPKKLVSYSAISEDFLLQRALKEMPVPAMISYSASFEDVLLQRALKEISHGCYVDVGAHQPLLDNNTAAFYELGWRGICIEPLQLLNEEWQQSRPDDLLINAVAGAQSGEATLYGYTAANQIATCSAEIVKLWQSASWWHDQEISVPMVTLNEIMEKHLNGRTIHLLSIDTEGFEKQVLQGFDLKKYCPWIIVIESVVPGTRTPSYHLWEAEVLAAGYTPVCDNSSNRFYVSNHKPELHHHFLSPPNAWDAFVPIRQIMAQQKYEALEEENLSLKAEIELIKSKLGS